MFTWNRHLNFILIRPYPTCRYIYMESPSELHPYSPLSHLQTYLHGITIRISPLFALIPPADIFTWNHHQNFALIHPYPTYRYVYIELPSEFHPYLPLSGLTDMFTLNRHQNFTLIHPYPTCRYVYIESPSEFHPYSPLSHLQTYLWCSALKHHQFCASSFPHSDLILFFSSSRNTPFIKINKSSRQNLITVKCLRRVSSVNQTAELNLP